MKLIKFLQQQSVGSRKWCRQLIIDAQIEIDGCTMHHPLQEIDPSDIGVLCIQGKIREVLPFPMYLLLHKPGHYEVSHHPTHYPSVFTLLPIAMQQLGLNAVGRLDADTTGLLLFTTDGAFIHALTSPRRHVPKRYKVTVKHAIDPSMVTKLQNGVLLKDVDEAICADEVMVRDSYTLALTLSEGRYHQVKRMVAAAGNRVEGLHREAIGMLELGDLPAGAWRYLSPVEREWFGF